VHNETSTGVTSGVAAVRRAIDKAGHPALLLVDTISSLGSIDYRHDEWGVDVTVGGSQKGLMLPPGLSFNAISDKAIAASKSAKLPRAFWDWEEMLAINGRASSLHALHEPAAGAEGRHRHAARGGARQRLRPPRPRRRGDAPLRPPLGLRDPVCEPAEYSSSLTAVRLPDGHSADNLRAEILERFNMSLGNGLGPLADKVFRIGHLGDFHQLMVTGVLTGVEMGLRVCGIPHKSGGVDVAMSYLAGNAGPAATPAN
jgi:alanine-glyoxylate transaminase/serine-glyoxylate transaminase/serine-pyruvate transaminase